MTGIRIGCIIGVWVLVLTVAQSFSQEEMRFVDNSVFEKSVRDPALFEHDIHNETAELEDCTVCHHLYDEDGELVEDESSEDQACSECHSTSGSGDTLSLRRAYHLNCKKCHMEEKAGPIMCAECHRTLPAEEASDE